MKVTDEMVERFLAWPLPSDLHIDLCVFDGAPHRNWPIGTNILNADQARAMLEQVLGGEPCPCRRCERERHDTVHGIPSEMTHMTVCPICGNKRCPHAEYHAYACSGSNNPWQKGERDRDISEIIAEAEKNPEDAAALDEARSKMRDYEYRRIWLERAQACFDYDLQTERPEHFQEIAEGAFDAADVFIAELKRREGK